MEDHKRRSDEDGVAHTILIIAALLLVTVGLLVYVFMDRANTESSSLTADTPTVARKGTKTFTTSKNILSFDYPSSWSASEVVASDDGDDYSVTVSVKNDQGVNVATLATGYQLGGTCPYPAAYTTLEAKPTTFKRYSYDDATSAYELDGTDALSYVALKKDDGTYAVHYGLSDLFVVEGESGEVCANTFYMTSGSLGFGLGGGTIGISFGNDVVKTKDFSTIDDAKAYLASNEYAMIKAMIMSLRKN